ncbi:hypothetical protein [Paraglaciecola sp.]|uniref:hypothetical protein n=1 Tax=Paraglaciecola sp. TaxID=1920173 RepID=UPI0030F3AB4C
MTNTSLEHFICSIQKDWEGLTSKSLLKYRELLKRLANASSDEPWLAKIHIERPATVELYSDPVHGYKLLAHTEPKGLYRKPHDHGAGWVLYAPQYGEIKMATYKQITNSNGKTQLISREADRLVVGDCKVFLPGDIHDTTCISDYLLQFRFTSCDFNMEKKQGRMIQFDV